MLLLSFHQQRIVEFIRQQGRATAPHIGSQLGMPPRTVRYHLDILEGRGLVEAHGERKGRYYTPATGDRQATLRTPESGTNAIIAEVYARGGRIRSGDLLGLVKKHGYDGRVVGALHGRRLAHLRKDPKTGESVLTSRRTEVARQYTFAARLAARAQRGSRRRGEQVKAGAVRGGRRAVGSPGIEPGTPGFSVQATSRADRNHRDDRAEIHGVPERPPGSTDPVASGTLDTSRTIPAQSPGRRARRPGAQKPKRRGRPNGSDRGAS